MRAAATLACAVLLWPLHAVAQTNRVVPWVGKTFFNTKCEGFHGTGGVYDYRKRAEYGGYISMIEEHHFTEGVENLTQGATTEPMGDIDFLLRRVPNHHRALDSAIKFRLQHRNWPKGGKGLPAECYLQRAISFAPNDVNVHLQYAVLQHEFKQYKGAIESYDIVNQLSGGDDVIDYNLGLALVEVKRYQRARDIARDLYSRGFPLQGLKKRLQAAGEWQAESTMSDEEKEKWAAALKENPGNGKQKKPGKNAKPGEKGKPADAVNNDGKAAQVNIDDMTPEQQAKWAEALKGATATEAPGP